MALFLVIALALFGALFLWIGLRLRQHGHASELWPSTVGHVLESRVDDSDSDSLSAKLRYEYTVNGQKHIGWRISFAGYSPTRRSIQEMLAEYPPHAAVPVYYDPADPARSTLKTGAHRDWLLPAGLGAAFLGVAVWLSTRLT